MLERLVAGRDDDFPRHPSPLYGILPSNAVPVFWGARWKEVEVWGAEKSLSLKGESGGRGILRVYASRGGGVVHGV
jgi:hypothetical protein